MFFVGNAGGNGNLSDNLNAAALLCSIIHLDALMISAVSERYPMAVICLL